MAGSVPHYVALGWSEANRGCVTTVEARRVDVLRDDRASEDCHSVDGSATAVVNAFWKLQGAARR